jgi:short-subunit dehydrogenase
LNIYAITFLTKFQITNWLKIRRSNERCAVIQLSSSGSDMPVPQLSHYAATKRYDDIFA